VKAEDGRREPKQRDATRNTGGEAAQEEAEDEAAREGVGEDLQGCGGKEENNLNTITYFV
jgi:hypothetical protein